MQDLRLTPSNGRVAAAELAGSVQAKRFVEGERLQCVKSTVNLHNSPDGGVARQLLFGEPFRVLERRSGWAFGQSVKDGYVGYLREAALGEQMHPTHWVSGIASHAYPVPDIRSPPIMPLYLGAQLACIEGRDGDFSQILGGGYVPASHVRRLNDRPDDFVEVAKKFLGCPYLWGGDTVCGIDCSGLIQVALSATGIACPRDSDMQEHAVGSPVDAGQCVGRGDLAFWKGHVGIMLDAENLLHATAHHMAVIEESFSLVRRRIAALSGHPFRGHRRI